MKRLIFTIGIAFVFIANTSYADLVTCSDLKIVDLGVTGERDDNMNENIMTFRLKDINGAYYNCAGKQIYALKSSEVNYKSILATALLAKATDSLVEVSVNTNILECAGNICYQVAAIQIQ